MVILVYLLGSTEGVPHRPLRHFNLSVAAPAAARTRTTNLAAAMPIRGSQILEHKSTDCINNDLILWYSTASTVI